MTTLTKPYRYQLARKAAKTDCPQCSPKHRKTFSHYVDSQTGETLPDIYGRCDRESNCGYHLSPYQKEASGKSYADEVNAYGDIPREWFSIAAKLKRRNGTEEALIRSIVESTGATYGQAERIKKYLFSRASLLTPTTLDPIYSLPDEVVKPSLGFYEKNQLARLLTRQFGEVKALTLLQQFQIGTSSRWPGACVFWLKDTEGRVRSGQVVLFADNWHKARYIDPQGETKICISSVSHSLLRRYHQQKQTPPDWLTNYHENAPRWPILFGLHQLNVAPVDQPVAVVEAPKTAIVCSAMILGFIWLAVGSLSYLNEERMAPLRGRKVMLFPDLSKDGKAAEKWRSIAAELNGKGYQVTVSDLLERNATDEQRLQGLDLADFLLTPTNPHWKIDGKTIEGEPLVCEPCHQYPMDWDIRRVPFVKHVKPPLAFDVAEQLRRIRWCVIRDDEQTIVGLMNEVISSKSPLK